MPKISAVVVSLNEGPKLRATVECLDSTLPAGSEILVVDDGSTDGSARFLVGAKGRIRRANSNHLGVAKARNWGASQTSGDIILFADAHIRMEPDWWEPLVDLLGNPKAGAVAPAIVDQQERRCKGFGLRLLGPDLTVDWLDSPGRGPFRAPILPGCCLAMRRDTFDATGGFDNGMIRWGSVDNELGVRLWLLGYELWVVPSVEVLHRFRRRHPYPVDWSVVMHNRLRLAFLHFDPPWIARVVEALRDHQGFAEGLALIANSDVGTRRAELASRRVHDEKWFFRRFARYDRRARDRHGSL